MDFGTQAILHLSYTVLEDSSGISKNKGTFLWNFVPNSLNWQNFAAARRLLQMLST